MDDFASESLDALPPESLDDLRRNGWMTSRRNQWMTCPGIRTSGQHVPAFVVRHVEPKWCSLGMKRKLENVQKKPWIIASRNASLVAMMQATYFGDRNHLADRLYGA